jgi:hypothetical protein
MKIRAGCEISYDCPQPTPTAASAPSLGPYKRMSIPRHEALPRRQA